MQENVDFDMTTIPMYMEQLNVFHEVYDFHKLVGMPSEPSKYNRSADRTCRFCGLSKPQTTFKNVPHIFSKLTGNRYGYSEFECDNCNSYFGRLENDLAYYLGITNNIREDIVKTHKHQKDLEIREHEIRGVKGILISKKNDDDESLIWDNHEKLIIKYLKRPYRPLNIYKTMLKYAISLLNENEVFEYRVAIEYLMSKIELDDSFQYLAIHDFPIFFNSPAPYALLFKKRNPSLNYPTHCFSIYFQNKIISLYLPLHFADMESFYIKENMNFLFPPPLMLVDDAKEDIRNTLSIQNFSSNSLVNDDVQEIHVDFPPLNPDELTAMDPVTGKKVKSPERTEVRSVFMVPSGATFQITPD